MSCGLSGAKGCDNRHQLDHAKQKFQIAQEMARKGLFNQSNDELNILYDFIVKIPAQNNDVNCVDDSSLHMISSDFNFRNGAKEEAVKRKIEIISGILGNNKCLC
jgi:hypothetical protein